MVRGAVGARREGAAEVGEVCGVGMIWESWGSLIVRIQTISLVVGCLAAHFRQTALIWN